MVSSNRLPVASTSASLIFALLVTASAIPGIGCRKASNNDTAVGGQVLKTAPEPWTRAQTVQPADLVKELANTSATTRSTVVYVGFRSLYRSGRVPGASSHGPASSVEGLADLKRWAQSVARSTDVVLYCGCCPFADCPNVQPAFTTLRQMGFTRLRVLILPNNFGTDWADKGYPVDR